VTDIVISGQSYTSVVLVGSYRDVSDWAGNRKNVGA